MRTRTLAVFGVACVVGFATASSGIAVAPSCQEAIEAIMPTLTAESTLLPSGDAQISLTLEAENFPGAIYIILGGMHGSNPGFDVYSGTLSTHIPLNWDDVTSVLWWSALNGVPVQTNLIGAMDPATNMVVNASVTLPSHPRDLLVILGMDFTFVAVGIDPSGAFPPAAFIAGPTTVDP